MNQKKKLLVTASTFPRWEKDTEPRFVLEMVVHMTDFYQVTVLAPGVKDKEILEGVESISFRIYCGCNVLLE